MQKFKNLRMILPSLPRQLVIGLLTVLMIVSSSSGSAREFATTLEQGETLFEKGDFEAARKVFETLGQYPEAQFHLGRLAFLKRDLEKAKDRFLKAVRDRPEVSEYQFWLGRTYGALALEGSTLERGMNARRSRIQFERAIELDQNHLEARYGLLTFHLLAPRMLGASRQQAVQQARAIQQRDAHAGFLAWAAIHEKDENWSAAEKSYRKAIDLRPSASNAVLRWTWLLQRQARFEEAFSILHTFLEHSPDSPKALYERGRTAAFSGLQLEQGKTALAGYLLHSPVGREPSLALAHFHLGMIHRHERKNDAAIAAFRKALALDPDLDEAKQNIRELDPTAGF